MGILEGRVVLITDTGTNAGYHLALTIAAAGARVVVNDKTGSGSVRAAADALATTILRRGGSGALPAYGGFKNIRDCIQMIRVAPDRWDWLSGIVHIGPGADDLKLLLRAAQPAMAQWGGMIVSLDTDDPTAAVITEHAEALTGYRITLNGVRAGDADAASMVCYLLSHRSSGVTGRVLRAEPERSAKDIADNIDAILAEQAKPAAKAKPAAQAKPQATVKPAAEPAAKAKTAAEPAAKAKTAAEPAAKAKTAERAKAKTTRKTSGKSRARKTNKSS